MLLLVSLMLLPTIIIGWVGYRTAGDVIKQEASRSVGIVASDKRDMLVYRLIRQREMAKNFLIILHDTCVHGHRGDLSCARRATSSFMKINGVIDADIQMPGLDHLILGPSAATLIDHAPFGPGQLAEFSSRSIANPYYLIDAHDDATGAKATLRFSTRLIEKIFTVSSELGKSGETFLADSGGYFLTQPKYPGHSRESHPIDAKPMLVCLAKQDGEILADDYRHVPVIHGFRYIPEIGGGCIMAHIQQTEAFAPLRTLKNQIIQLAVLFSALAVAASTLIGHRFSLMVSRPLQRLVERVQLARVGDLEAPVSIEGPIEVQTLARGFADLTESLHQSNQARDDFVSIVSHDLKSPLTAIALVASLDEKILRTLPEPIQRELQPSFAHIRQNVEHMSQLIEGLLNRAVMKTGHFIINVRRHEISPLVFKIVEMFRPLAADKNVELKVSLPTDPLFSEFDSDRIHEVCSNLMANAIKFTPRGGCVTFQVSPEKDRIRMGVLDTGPGIPADEIQHVFERFYTRKKTGASGVGLGLYIAKQIITAHGETIWVESEPGRGARFYFTVPLKT